MMLNIGLLIGGFIFLAKGAEWFVKGSEDIGHRLHLPQVVIGLTLVAFGTSAPELAVNLFALSGQQYDMIMGNILGSNIANLLLILGTISLLTPITFSPKLISREVPFSLVITLLLGFGIFYLNPSPQVTKTFGLLLLGFFALFLMFMLTSQKSPVESPNIDRLFISILKLMVGLGLLIGSGKIVVHSGTNLALHLGISEAVVSLIAIALGTSLPELATSIIAAIKKNTDLIAGNVIGSNIFNLALILGICGSIQPITVNPEFLKEFLIIIGVTFVLSLTLLVKGKKEVSWGVGSLFLVGYVIYVGGQFFRGF